MSFHKQLLASKALEEMKEAFELIKKCNDRKHNDITNKALMRITNNTFDKVGITSSASKVPDMQYVINCDKIDNWRDERPGLFDDLYKELEEKEISSKRGYFRKRKLIIEKKKQSLPTLKALLLSFLHPQTNILLRKKYIRSLIKWKKRKGR